MNVNTGVEGKERSHVEGKQKSFHLSFISVRNLFGRYLDIHRSVKNCVDCFYMHHVMRYIFLLIL